MNTVASVEDLKGYVGVTNDSDDLRLQRILDSSVKLVENLTKRKFTMQPALDAEGNDTGAAVTKMFSTYGKTYLKIPDLRSATEIDINGFPLTPRSEGILFGYVLQGGPDEPFTALQIYQWSLSFAGYWTDGLGDLNIRGRWGWNPPPPDIEEAVLALAARRYKEKDANWSDSVMLPESGMLSYFRSMPPLVKEVISQYRIPSMALV